MKRLFLGVICVILSIGLTGCASFGRAKAKIDKNAGTTPLPPYSGLKARIAVADFEVKAAKATFEVGSGLREMLVTALINSSRFSLVERQELASSQEEQESAVSAANQQQESADPKKGKIKAADLIITAAVTEFEPQASGGRAGVGGGGGANSGALGGLLGTALNKAHLALDIRIIDTSTSEVVAATRAQGQAADATAGFMAGFFSNSAFGTGLSAYANTPMEKAIRICIIEAVRYISQNIPATYYKY